MTDQLHAAYHCAAEVVRRRRLTGEPIPQWLREHYADLDAAVRMSQSGQETDSDTAEFDIVELITAEQAAVLLGRSKRQVTRIARSDLDGRLIGGRWLFDRAVVTEYAEQLGES